MLAVAHAQGEDGLPNTLSLGQWELLAGYLRPQTLETGEVLFHKGVVDRNLYLVESGSLSVHFEDSKGRLRLALIGAGSVVGEGAFFSHLPRSATVQANNLCRLWVLTALRFAELANRHPALALALVLGVASVQARRMPHRRLRAAST